MRISRHIDASREVDQPHLLQKGAITAGKPDRGRARRAKNVERGTTGEALGMTTNIATWVYEGGAGGEVWR
jgi:hypothetical protein